MVEPGLAGDEPLIEIYINADSDEENEAVTNVLRTLDVEGVVRQTLQAVHIEQPVTLTLVVSNDTEIQTLNRQYRRQDKPTDVLSFPLLDQPLVRAPTEWLWQVPEQQAAAENENQTRQQKVTSTFVTPDTLCTNLGDIVISWPMVQRQAREAGHTAAYELLFLLCHGVLHLVGYDDQTEAGYTEMVRLQKKILTDISQKG